MIENKIEIKMFHEFDILVDDKSIFYSITRLPVIIELLQYMLSNYNNELSPNKIAEDIWPEKEYFDSKKVLRTYIYRLKLFLSGSNPLNTDISKHIIISNIKGRYKLTLSDNCTFDVKTFYEEYKKIELTLNDIQDINLLKNLLSLYKGHFLPNIVNTHWDIPIRNLYLDIFCKLSNTILSYYYLNSNFKDLIKTCELIFEIYDLDEQSNVLFLNSLIAEERISDALHHYSYITSKMYNELDVRPTEDLKQIYIKLKKPMNTTKLQLKKANPQSNINPRNIFWRKFSYMTKRRNYKDIKVMTVAIVRFYKKNDENIQHNESLTINESIKYILDNVFDKKYTFTFLNAQMGVLILNDVKQNFVNLIPKMIYDAWDKNNNILNSDILIEVNLKSISPTEKSNLTYEERVYVE